jgi:hypothetical protein
MPNVKALAQTHDPLCSAIELAHVEPGFVRNCQIGTPRAYWWTDGTS